MINRKSIYILICLFLLLAICLFTCNKCGSGNASKNSSETVDSSKLKKQLNITILLDLSDRIDVKKYPETPEHYQRDLEVVKHLSKYFVADMEKRGTFMSKGKLKIIFSPKPNDPNINIIATKLNVDVSQMDVKQKKEIHDSLATDFTNNLAKIYSTTLEENKWIGSDIWRFFKNDVKDYCIERDSSYRNILVILTDGYIYHQDSREQQENRYAYILPNLFDKYHLRHNQNWQTEIKNQNFGLISKRDDLQNLEVLVLEVTPSPNYKDDEDIIKIVLANWFNEMKVKRFAIYNSDLPEYTKQRIDDFIK